jgi:hypothetical protein
VAAAPHEGDDEAGAREPAGAPEVPAPAYPPPPPPTPTDDDGPGVRVHADRLERRVGPLELSPTEALRLADEGPTGLSRRELPPDAARTRSGEGEAGGSGGGAG